MAASSSVASKLVNRRPSIEVIGLEEKVKDFEKQVLFPRKEIAGPRVVGIFGPGGIGKTTLAKKLFESKSSSYSKSCFLSNVRENVSSGSLILLQNELLKNLTRSEPPTDSIDEGMKALKTHLSSFRVLVILDDVDEVDNLYDLVQGQVNQVDALLPDRTGLYSDSLILITSRNRNVLKSYGVEDSSIYELDGLNTQHSRELFCLHSFNKSYPLPGFESLVDAYLEACNGLPLFLKVFGSLLYGKNDHSYWEEQLGRLGSKSEIEMLRISYDVLDYDTKPIFLDIACFFIGQNRDTAIKIWEGSGWNGLSGFQYLESKGLVEVDTQNNIQMHDHLRDLGRDVANTLSPFRVWRCIDVLSQQKTTDVIAVRGIKMDLSEGDGVDDVLDGIDVRRLQLLDAEDGLVERILKKVNFSNLIWLRWKKCPHSSLSSRIPMKNLRVLQLSGSILKTLWNDESQFQRMNILQIPLQLRELEVNAPLSNIPKSIGQLQHLERIVVGGFLSGHEVNLTKLPEEFCHLQSLKVLVLRECSKMKSLPESFGDLWNLQHLDLSFCRNLERMPDSFGDLWNLKHINLSDCHDLERLPDSIDHLRHLQHIDLRGCHNLERLPNSFGNLTVLRHMNLSGCHDLERLPDSFGNVRSLEHIDMQGCRNLKKLPKSLGNFMYLQHINLSNCRNLKRLPDSFGNLRNLEWIDLSGCHNLERLPNYFRNFVKLRYLDVEGCSNLIIETPDISVHLDAAHKKHLEQLYFNDVEH